ncbi:MAG: HEPN domain-containing protein [Chloroflexi bacterium]|nr:HEPN domain-containing protein [Chloroflexota bacterium]
MKAQTRARVKKIVNALKPYNPDRIILFGSAARGDADRYSDIDLAIIKDTDARFLDRLAVVYDLIDADFAFDALVYTPNEFEEMQARENPFVEQILRDGIVIYDAHPPAAFKAMRETPGEYGMKKTHAQNEGHRWLEQAQADLAAAKWNAQGGFYSVACFWAQQTAERALKAFLYFRGKRRIVGHSVQDLVNDCIRLDADFKSLLRPAKKLDHYYIPTRYPNGLPGGIPARAYDADEATEALELAEQAVTLVAQKISPAQDTPK